MRLNIVDFTTQDGLERLSQQVLGVAQDDIQRRAQLMADIGQQARLNSVGLLSRQTRLLNLIE